MPRASTVNDVQQALVPRFKALADVPLTLGQDDVAKFRLIEVQHHRIAKAHMGDNVIDMIDDRANLYAEVCPHVPSPWT